MKVHSLANLAKEFLFNCFIVESTVMSKILKLKSTRTMKFVTVD